MALLAFVRVIAAISSSALEVSSRDDACSLAPSASCCDAQVTWTAATRTSESNDDEIMTRATARKVWQKLIEGGHFAHALTVPGTLADNRRVVQNLPIYC